MTGGGGNRYKLIKRYRIILMVLIYCVSSPAVIIIKNEYGKV